MNGIYLDWFQNPKNIHDNVFNKISASLVGEKRVPKHFYSILRNRAHVDVEIKWTDCLDVFDELDWNDTVFTEPTSIVPLKLIAFFLFQTFP